ncbi:MAG: amylo-alpha-1,6-glucosidase [Candidatus Thermoplasmatota archaeon]|jgi:predicted glycogen debranching enzyme|nr:amylo-alpha-1,6-glucosidase [Candidatus Thermoplasmatota archaeon]
MREWIVTNGLGGYASLTHSNTNTRKFHGLLVASLEPPAKRWVFVTNVYDKLMIDDRTYDLRNIKGKFVFETFPSILYDIENVHIKKTFFMEHGKNTSIVRYSIITEKPVVMIHNPVLNSRHFYDTTKPGDVSFKQEAIEDGVCIKPSNIDRELKMILHDSLYEPDEYWEEFYYKTDHERKDSWIDHNIHIGDFYKEIKSPFEYYLIFTLEDEIHSKPLATYAGEVQRKKNLLEKAALNQKFEKLVLSADNFIVKKDDEKSVIAGYHWFGDWGRDTLISLPGLTLVTKRYDDAKQILLNFARYCKKGLIPNNFVDRDSTPAYNTVDASLWYIDRVYQYMKYTDDQEFLQKIWDTLQSIIENYRIGTEYGIHMDKDFLISHWPGLTWMDVKIGDNYITPRSKKAVEVQALWYNALMVMGALSKACGKPDNYSYLAGLVKESFNNQYDKQYDVIDTRDLSCRPNKIFLASLDFSMISKDKEKWILDDVENRLLTIFGLRTLAVDDPRYIGGYIGDFNRDLAYHNGCVWPWLLGPFIKAFVKTKNYERTWREYAYQNFLKPMFDVFGENWDGSIYEIFDGDPPFVPQGCITQAWSVAEILRAWVEDIEQIKPKYDYNFFLLHEISI